MESCIHACKGQEISQESRLFSGETDLSWISITEYAAFEEVAVERLQEHIFEFCKPFHLKKGFVQGYTVHSRDFCPTSAII